MSIIHFVYQSLTMLVIQSVKRCSRHQLPSQQQVATKQSKAVMQRPSQSSTHNNPLNCHPWLVPSMGHSYPSPPALHQKVIVLFLCNSGSDVDGDGFRVRAQGWTDG